MPTYFPLHADIAGKRCVVVGGGTVAERKVADLLASGALVRVVSPEAATGLRQQAQLGQIEWVEARYCAHHLEGAWLVFAATDNREVNAQVAQDALARRIWVNVADAPDEGDFIVPGVVRHGGLCLSVSTGGGSPLLTRKLTAALGAAFGPEYAGLIELLGAMRAMVKTQSDSPLLRRAALSRLVEHEAELRELLRADKADEARELAQRLAADALSNEQT